MHIFLADKILRPEIKHSNGKVSVRRQLITAYSLLSDEKLKITAGRPFQAGSDEFVMVSLPRRKNAAGDVL